MGWEWGGTEKEVFLSILNIILILGFLFLFFRFLNAVWLVCVVLCGGMSPSLPPARGGLKVGGVKWQSIISLPAHSI